MEFPDLGQHCSESICRKLDFLPVKCDACDEVFCKDHIRYDDHHCSSAYKKNVQVPVCPLCGQPVPVPRGETPDIKVGEHIDRDCQSDPAKKKRKAFSNRCSAPRCKQHELMPVVCSECRLNFCLRHRHPQDHGCRGFQGTGRSVSNTGAAAIQRSQAASSSKQRTNVSKIISRPPQQTYMHGMGRDLDKERRQRQQQNARQMQSNMSEDEALARALQMSQEEHQNKPMTQEEKDLALARQLQEEEEENRRRLRRAERERNKSESSCKLS
ncbi:AN1-type zinc finger protein 2A-like [Clavelina lepadiformis]|uniref:AN1-type zinc finger protein 2A-like n=1 Tax=Clavelina lepadiformis TaxID=159417 RepID=UPI004042E290